MNKQFLLSLLAFAAVGVMALPAAQAQVFLDPDKQKQFNTGTAASSSAVFLATPPKRRQASQNTNFMPDQVERPVSGVALSAAQYNKAMAAQRAQNAEQYEANRLLARPTYAATPTLEDDGETYYDEPTGMFMKKPAYAAELWARGDDPNAVYPGKFPAPPRADPMPAMAGTATWSNTMPGR